MIPLIALLMVSLGTLLSLIARSVNSAANLSVVIGLMLAFTAGIWFLSWMQIIGKNIPRHMGDWGSEVDSSL